MLLYNFLQDYPNSKYLKTRDYLDNLYETEFQGIKICIEQPKGSIIQGTDKDGKKWQSLFYYPYGYIKDSKGADKEEIDVFIGPEDDAEIVYIVNQRSIENGKYDEQKVLLGFPSEEAARDAYLAHYDIAVRKAVLGPIKQLTIKQFKEKLDNGKTKL